MLPAAEAVVMLIGVERMKKKQIGSWGRRVKSQNPVSCGTFSCTGPTLHFRLRLIDENMNLYTSDEFH
jgi:hypothetical protein